MTTRAKSHGFVTKGFHWLTGGMLAYGYYKGLESVDQLADPALLQFEVMFASALGLAFLARLGWTRLVGGATRLPAATPAWERHVSGIVHWGALRQCLCHRAQRVGHCPCLLDARFFRPVSDRSDRSA